MTGQSLQSHDGWTLCSISPSQHLFFPVHHVQTGEPMSQYNNGSIHIFMLSFSETTRRSAGTHIPLPYPRPPNIHLVGAPSAISSTTRRRALLTSYLRTNRTIYQEVVWEWYSSVLTEPPLSNRASISWAASFHPTRRCHPPFERSRRWSSTWALIEAQPTAHRSKYAPSMAT